MLIFSYIPIVIFQLLWVVATAGLYKQNLIGDLNSGPWVENELKPMVKQEYNWLKSIAHSPGYTFTCNLENIFMCS